MAIDDQDATSLLEKMEWRVFIPTARKDQVARRYVQRQGWKHSIDEGGQHLAVEMAA